MSTARLTNDPVTLELKLLQETRLGLFVCLEGQTAEQSVVFRWDTMRGHELRGDRVRVTALESEHRMRGLLP